MASVPRLEKAYSPGCYTLRSQFRNDWEQKLLLISDIHFDAVGCRRQIFKRHLEQAKAANAPVLIFGDLLDLMQGKKDPRATKHAIRPQYLHEDYLGAVTDDVTDFLEPYAENITLLAQGNHEYEYRRNHEIDPLTIVAMKLEAKSGFRPIVAPYTGWVMLKYEYLPGATGYRGRRHSHYLKYFHGVGGNSPVTKGAIQSNRSAVRWPNADIVVMGHIHHRFSMSMPRETITNRGRLITDEEGLHIQLGCYVQDDDGDSWSQRRGFGTSALGGYWLRLYTQSTGEGRPIKFQAITTD